MAEFEGTGVSRREALKRGAVMGGALVWAMPVVQTVGMNATFAQDPSPCTCGMEITIECVEVGINGFPAIWCTVINTGTKGGPNSLNDCCLTEIAFEASDGLSSSKVTVVPGPVCPGEQTSTRADVPGAVSGQIFTLSAEALCNGTDLVVAGPVQCVMP